MSVEEVGQEPLSSPTPFLIPQIQPSFGEEQRQHRQSLPSFRQFVHQTHSPETPQSFAQIHDLEERRHLSSSTGLVASTPAAHPWKASDDIPLFSEHEDDGRTQMVVEEGTMTGTPHHVQRRQYPKKVDSISVLAAAAAEIEREADMFSGQTGAGHGHSNIQFGSTYHSPTTSVKSSSTDVSAKAPSEPATHRSSSSSGNSSSSSQHSTWLWRRPTDNQWVQRKQTSPPKRGRSEDYEDYEMTMIKQEEDNGTYGVGSSSMTKRSHIELPHKKRKSSLTFTHLASSRAASSSSSHRPIKRSTESMTDDTRSEMQSEGDDHYLFQQRHQQHPEPQPPKAKKKRMSKPKDPNYVSPSGFRHGGERRVQEPDEVVEMPEDVGPVSMLQGTNLPKVTWKGTPLPVDGKPGAERLHPHEAYIASTLRLSPAQYLLCKKTLILASRGFQSNHKVFRKTDAQKLCHVDVNKASKLWEVFTKIGWLAGSAEEDV
ncbi:hypothetical protein BGZ73_008164 [Actinomortierella ambigua]|nr:hypothetical protein BGZ73_008164 [Actinomortierella ambigua]